MKPHTKRNKYKKRKNGKTFKKMNGIKKNGGGPTSKGGPPSSFNVDEIIKNLLIDNVNNRYVENPKTEDIRDWTIYRANRPDILEYISSAKEIDPAHSVLSPVLSKGSYRLINLKIFIREIDTTSLPDKIKAILISQYIILNQVFGDGNHRAGLYILRNHSPIHDEKYIQKIMKITEQIHKYDGDLRSNGFWNPDSEGVLKPDLSKIDEMLSLIGRVPL
jgi:hypothetical protein